MLPQDPESPRYGGGAVRFGVDVLTGGNHTWDKREGLAFLDNELRCLRPANYPDGAPGRGVGVYSCGEERISVVNLLGRVFLQTVDCPFVAADRILESLSGVTNLIVVDMHAEATSEKIGIGWYLDGRASVVVGTHTHVQTADERILPRGTAYQTDAGMTGPHDSVIGFGKELALEKLRTQLPVRFHPAEADIRLHGPWVRLDPATGRAAQVRRIERGLTERMPAQVLDAARPPRRYAWMGRRVGTCGVVESPETSLIRVGEIRLGRLCPQQIQGVRRVRDRIDLASCRKRRLRMRLRPRLIAGRSIRKSMDPLQLPCRGRDPMPLLLRIPPEKDVDGFHLSTSAALLQAIRVHSCTPPRHTRAAPEARHRSRRQTRRGRRPKHDRRAAGEPAVHEASRLQRHRDLVHTGTRAP
jgi:metallophosphoesterase (TIGR00282 family)